MNLNKKARREALLETTNNEKYLYQLVATYDKTIGNHEINLIAGTSFEETMFEYTSMDSWDFGSDDIQTFNAATGFRSWNDYDRIDSNTTFLHTTQRVTQPWRKGLAIDTYLKPIKPILGFIPRRKVHRILKKPLSDMYIGHPDKEVNKFFFSELSAAINQGFISVDEIRAEIRKENIRKDIFSLLTLNEA